MFSRPQADPGLAGGRVEVHNHGAIVNRFNALWCEHLLRDALKQNNTLFHHYDAVAILGDKVNVVGYKDHAQFPAPAQGGDEAKNISLVLQIQKRGGQLILNLQRTQPELEADAVHLTNMVYNLLDNAIKYTPEAPRIEISTVSTPDKIILSVSDNGVGISKEDQKKIFDKLYRVPTGNLHNVKGFGLGLSYVKAIVEQHGGQVNVKSILGKGSTFEAHLPYKTTFVHG